MDYVKKLEAARGCEGNANTAIMYSALEDEYEMWLFDLAESKGGVK